MHKFLSISAIAACLGLAACGDTTAQRAVVGGAIGCAAGEVLANGRCVEGAVVGAGVGVITE